MTPSRTKLLLHLSKCSLLSTLDGTSTLRVLFLFNGMSFFYFSVRDTLKPIKLSRTKSFYLQLIVRNVLTYHSLLHTFAATCSLPFSIHVPFSSQCAGYLETYYAVSNETFFADLSGQPLDPLGSVRFFKTICLIFTHM